MSESRPLFPFLHIPSLSLFLLFSNFAEFDLLGLFALSYVLCWGMKFYVEGEQHIKMGQVLELKAGPYFYVVSPLPVTISL